MELPAAMLPARRPSTPRPARAVTAATLAVLAGGTAAGCTTRAVVPRVAPEGVAPLAPPLPRRALLLLTPAFAEHVTSKTRDEPVGPERTDYRLGPAAGRLLGDWVARSFAGAEVRRLSEQDALRTLVTGEGAGGAEVILLPRFEPRGEVVEDRAMAGRRVTVRLRVDARSLATGAVRSWLVEGRAGREGFGAGEAVRTGRALERAMAALGDTLAAHRGAL